jgi:hypothetical protein
MAKAVITIEDTADGKIDVGADFGEAIDDNSNAHGMAQVLIQSVLANAKNYQTIEDTAPEHNIEPSRIITPTN